MKQINFDPTILTQSLIQCPSITPKDEGALQIVEDHLNHLGFVSKKLIFSEKNFDDINNLFSTIGSSGKHLAFAGHTDVVPIGNEESWDYPAFEGKIVGDKLYGRGAEDMKGNIACFISATNSFIKKYGKEFGGKISFIITGDEEKDAINGTPKIMQWCKKNNIFFNDCIVGEPTSDKFIGDKLKIGRRGSISFFLTARGIQGHTANSHLAENPTHHLIALLNNIISEPLDMGNEYFLPTSIQIPTIDVGNPASNIIPEVAKAKINIRFNNLHTGSSITHWLEKKIKEVFGKIKNSSCTFHKDAIYAESFITKPGKLCSTISKSICEITGKNSDPILATDGGTSDARFIKDYCEVVELGIRNQTLHKTNEFVYLADLKRLYEIYLRILENYFDKN